MSEPPEPHGEYMFGILAYETWRIFDGDLGIGLVTLNGPDNWVKWESYDGYQEWDAMFGGRTFSWWMRWLKRHQRPIL